MRRILGGLLVAVVLSMNPVALSADPPGGNLFPNGFPGVVAFLCVHAPSFVLTLFGIEPADCR